MVSLHTPAKPVLGLVFLGLFWLSLPVAAQQENRQPSRPRSVITSGQPTGSPAPASSLPADSQATPNQTRSEINLAVAHELLDLTGFPSLVKQTIIKGLQKEMRKRPDMSEISSFVRDFLQKRISVQIITEEMARYLADKFDAQELRQLKAIMDTGAGRKMFTSFDTLPAPVRLREASYLEIFDEQETIQFKTFYRLPVFQKFSDYLPTLFQIGKQSFDEQYKLQEKEMFMEKVRQLQEESPQP